MKLDDAQILEVIAELRRSSYRHRPGLPRLRRELKRRFACSAGTDRLSHLLKLTMERPPTGERAVLSDSAALSDRAALPYSPVAGDTAQVELLRQIGELSRALEELRRALEQAQTRAELAEHRADAYQDRWAAEVDALRQQVRQLGGDPYGR